MVLRVKNNCVIASQRVGAKRRPRLREAIHERRRKNGLLRRLRSSQ
jgi:hypothetical protein